MTTTQTTSTREHRTANPEGRLALMKDRAAAQSTQTLCEAVVMLASLPRTPETNLTRAVMTDVLCERHPEAEAAAQAWAESDDDETPYDAIVVSAALTAIGA